MSGEQKIRGILYYISVLVFILGLPFILTYTMGYQFDRKTFKFTRTGLISLKTDPPGASVYLDGALVKEKTPCSINELLPGKYHIELALDGFYAYSSDIEVFASKVTRMEKVILFPLRADVKQLNQERISAFWVDESRSQVYYVNIEENAIYRSDLDGEHFELAARFVAIRPAPKEWLFSPDKERLLYYNSHQIGIVNLRPDNQTQDTEKQYVITYPSDAIRDIFWYSDSYHIIVIGDRQIAMVETKPNAMPFTLTTLNKRNTSATYDPRNEILYFSDSQRAEDGKAYDNIYKLELKTKLYPFRDFLKLKPDDREQKN